MMEGSGAESGSESGAGTILVTNGSGCGSGMPKTYGSYGAGSGSVTLLGGRGNGAVVGGRAVHIENMLSKCFHQFGYTHRAIH